MNFDAKAQLWNIRENRVLAVGVGINTHIDFMILFGFYTGKRCLFCKNFRFPVIFLFFGVLFWNLFIFVFLFYGYGSGFRGFYGFGMWV